MWMGWHEGFGWWTIFGGIWMVIVWAAIIGFAVWAVTRVVEARPSGRAGAHPESESALEIAKRRLARGEITMAEFEELRKVLQ